jgi:hypothetical protein
MRLRYAGRCGCGVEVAAGTRAGWDRTARSVLCPACLAAIPGSVPIETRREPGIESATESEAGFTDHGPDSGMIVSGPAGGSAQREYERRKDRREQRIRQAHPRLGGLILALSSEPQSTRAWQSGAVGERRVAERLAGLGGDEVLALHDRRIPGSRANIDHIAIGPAGVYVIDAKRYNNAKVEVRRSGGLFTPRREQLYVAGRDKSSLVAGLEPQLRAVESALSDLDSPVEVPIRGMLCFIDALLPLFSTLTVAEVAIVGRKGMTKLVQAAGPFTADVRQRIHSHLAARLPAMR